MVSVEFLVTSLVVVLIPGTGSAPLPARRGRFSVFPEESGPVVSE